MSLIIYSIICIPQRRAPLRLGIPLVCGAGARWPTETPGKTTRQQPQKLCLDCKFTSQTLLFNKLLWKQGVGLMFYVQIASDESQNEPQRCLFVLSFIDKIFQFLLQKWHFWKWSVLCFHCKQITFLIKRSSYHMYKSLKQDKLTCCKVSNI